VERGDESPWPAIASPTEASGEVAPARRGAKAALSEGTARPAEATASPGGSRTSGRGSG
ncbi:hypothetical protein SK128_023476, partial [Halocaridina rubra]